MAIIDESWEDGEDKAFEAQTIRALQARVRELEDTLQNVRNILILLSVLDKKWK